MTRAIKPCHAWVALAILMSVVSGVAASEQAEMLYSRGLVEFHAERYEGAIRWFDRAVESDPADVPSRYYRAMARARMDDRSGALRDLQQALQLRPEFDAARIELAGLLIEEERYDEAIAQLKEVQHVPGIEGRANFLLGIAYMRQGDLAAADDSFRYAAQRDPKLAATSSYYRGIIAYRQKDSKEARQRFSAALRQGAGASVGREAASGLQAVRSGIAQRFMIYAEAGAQYDTNVCLLPDDDGTFSSRDGCVSFDSDNVGEEPIGDEDDVRGVFTAGGFVRPWMNDRVQITLGYEFYQSIHFDLEQFNLQDHRPRAQVTADLGPVTLGMLGQYDYYFLQDNSFLQEITGVAWMIVPEGDIGRFEIFFRERRRDFKMLLFDVRDAFNHSPGLRQLFYLGAPDRYLYLGYRYDREDPDDSTGFSPDPNEPGIDAQAFRYDGHEGNVGVRWMWPRNIPTEVSFAYRNERYGNESRATDLSSPPSRRDDDEIRVRAYLELPWSLVAPDVDILNDLSLALGYMYTLNMSNQSNFDYDRHIASATIQFRY